MFGINDKNRRLIMVASLLVISGALFFIVHNVNQQSATNEIGSNMQTIVGETCARELIRLMGEEGRIAVLTLDTSEQKIVPATCALNGFLNAIKKHPHLKVVTTEKLAADPLTMMNSSSFGIPVETFHHIVTSDPELDAIVSFVGAPKLTAGQMSQMIAGQRRPKVIVVSSLGYCGPWVKPLLKAGFIQAAIMPNPTPVNIMDSRQRTAREWYEMLFAVVTAETADKLPE